MFPAIAAILTALGSTVSGFFTQRAELGKAEFETKLAIEKGKQALVSQQVELSNKLQIAQLDSTPKFFKILTFLGWTLPYIIIIVDPIQGERIFDNLSKAPLWYIQTTQVLLFATWGIAVSKTTIASIFGNLIQDIQIKKKYQTKLEKLDVDKKEFYNKVRAIRGSLNQEQVDLLEDALNTLGTKDAKKG